MSKVLIDIPENFKYFKQCRLAMAKAIDNGIVLDDLTNGEIIQKMFPEAKFCCTERLQTVGLPRRDVDFDLDWWNRKWGE